MSYASDALLKETAAKVAQHEKLFVEFRKLIDELSAKVNDQRPQITLRSNRVAAKE